MAHAMFCKSTCASFALRMVSEAGAAIVGTRFFTASQRSSTSLRNGSSSGLSTESCNLLISPTMVFQSDCNSRTSSAVSTHSMSVCIKCNTKSCIDLTPNRCGFTTANKSSFASRIIDTSPCNASLFRLASSNSIFANINSSVALCVASKSCVCIFNSILHSGTAPNTPPCVIFDP